MDFHSMNVQGEIADYIGEILQFNDLQGYRMFVRYMFYLNVQHKNVLCSLYKDHPFVGAYQNQNHNEFGMQCNNMVQFPANIIFA